MSGLLDGEGGSYFFMQKRDAPAACTSSSQDFGDRNGAGPSYF